MTERRYHSEHELPFRPVDPLPETQELWKAMEPMEPEDRLAEGGDPYAYYVVKGRFGRWHLKRTLDPDVSIEDEQGEVLATGPSPERAALIAGVPFDSVVVLHPALPADPTPLTPPTEWGRLRVLWSFLIAGQLMLGDMDVDGVPPLQRCYWWQTPLYWIKAAISILLVRPDVPCRLDLVAEAGVGFTPIHHQGGVQYRLICARSWKSLGWGFETEGPDAVLEREQAYVEAKMKVIRSIEDETIFGPL